MIIMIIIMIMMMHDHMHFAKMEIKKPNTIKDYNALS